MDPPDDVLVLLVLALAVLPPPVHHAGVHVCRAGSVRLVQQAYLGSEGCRGHYILNDCLWERTTHHGQEDGPDVLCGVPPLTGQLAGLGVVHRGVQDGHAQVAVLDRLGSGLK